MYNNNNNNNNKNNNKKKKKKNVLCFAQNCDTVRLHIAYMRFQRKLIVYIYTKN